VIVVAYVCSPSTTTKINCLGLSFPNLRFKESLERLFGIFKNVYYR